MLVCICKGISDKDIDAALQDGIASYSDVRSNLGVGTCCGQCASFAKEMFAQKLSQNQSMNDFQLAYEVGA